MRGRRTWVLLVHHATNLLVLVLVEVLLLSLDGRRRVGPVDSSRTFDHLMRGGDTCEGGCLLRKSVEV